MKAFVDENEVENVAYITVSIFSGLGELVSVLVAYFPGIVYKVTPKPIDSTYIQCYRLRGLCSILE